MPNGRGTGAQVGRDGWGWGWGYRGGPGPPRVLATMYLQKDSSPGNSGRPRSRPVCQPALPGAWADETPVSSSLARGPWSARPGRGLPKVCDWPTEAAFLEARRRLWLEGLAASRGGGGAVSRHSSSRSGVLFDPGEPDCLIDS